MRTLLTIFLLLLAAPPLSASDDAPMPGNLSVYPRRGPAELASSFTLLPPDLAATAPLQAPPESAETPISLEKIGEIAALHFTTASPISPYVGAGLDQIDEDSESVLEALAHRDQGTGYQLGAGVGVELGKTTRLGLDYRYAPATTPSLMDSSPTTEELDSDRHRISFGLEVLF